MPETFQHLPVLLAESIEALSIKPGGLYLDGTAGGAGHALEIAKRLLCGRLICLDKDPQAVQTAAERLRDHPCARVLESDFRDAGRTAGIEKGTLDGALLDLGVSSHQLDSPTRGFSYSHDGALDMRMSGRGMSAADIVNEWPASDLADILVRYGEEPYASLIARKIVSEREKQRVRTTGQLTDIVLRALPARVRRKEKHPARRTFQALRIAVNDELEALGQGLSEIFELLAPQGRLCVITFHSLEDRIVKQFFAEKARGCTCPRDLPVCVCGRKPEARLITRKPVVPAQGECETNRRARSAKLRVLEKL